MKGNVEESGGEEAKQSIVFIYLCYKQADMPQGEQGNVHPPTARHIRADNSIAKTILLGKRGREGRESAKMRSHSISCLACCTTSFLLQSNRPFDFPFLILFPFAPSTARTSQQQQRLILDEQKKKKSTAILALASFLVALSVDCC